MRKDKPLLTIAAVEEELKAIDIRTYSYPTSYESEYESDFILKQKLERRLETLKLLQELGLLKEEELVKDNSPVNIPVRFTVMMVKEGIYEVHLGEKYIGVYMSYMTACRAGNEAYNKELDKRIKKIVNKLFEFTERTGRDYHSDEMTEFIAIKNELKELNLIEDMD